MFQVKYLDIETDETFWRGKSHCQNEDPELFFPVSRFTKAFKLAAQICQTCPVSSECLQTAMQSRETVGVWGGVLFQANGEQYEYNRN